MPAAAAAPRNLESRQTLGVMDSIRTCLATTAKVIRTRLEIISTEIEEQREWLQNLLLLAVAGLFCLSMGLILVTLLVVTLFWESHPVAVLGGFSALYLGVGIWAALSFRQKLQQRPKVFAATTRELAKDETELSPAR